MPPTSDRAVLLLNFGEPSSHGLDEVTAYLERIFRANQRLEAHDDPSEARRRSRELAEARAPGLARTYETIGGSPLDRQARDQSLALERSLADRGVAMSVDVGMQFTSPSIEDALARVRERDPTTVVALPVYPLCGPSTTLAALAAVRHAAQSLGWDPDIREITGWHRHPGYVSLRARAVRQTARDAGLDLGDPAVRVLFSAHGTPLSYVKEGSRYVQYVEDWCELQSVEIGLVRWTLGYQNHANRDIEWTSPDVEDALASLEKVTDVVVDPISFAHEQSETLMELDVDLAAHSESLGIRFHRVPIRHDDPAFVDVLTDLVLLGLGHEVANLSVSAPCLCRDGAGVCLNAEPALAPRRT